jgi:hypothetical protein
VTGRRLSDGEVDRLLRDALADDLPAGLEGELRRGTRLAWRRAASRPPRARWRDGLVLPAAWKPVLPQPALLAAALAMLGLGTAMQAAPPPPAVVESFQGHEAAALTAQALGRARAMECVVEVADEGGHRTSYTVGWRAPGETRVRIDAGAKPVERSLRFPGARPSVLTSTAERGASLDPALEPVRAYLSPAALGERLAAEWRRATGEATAQGAETFLVGPRTGPTRLTVAIDGATHLPVRLDAADRDGRRQAAVCRWR